MLTQEQIARLLALAIGWRRRLASMPGPGWWVNQAGNVVNATADPACEVYDKAGNGAATLIALLWAWAPADRLAWLEATGQVYGVLRHSDNAREAYTVGERGGKAEFTSDAACPIDAALSYMESHNRPEQSP